MPIAFGKTCTWWDDAAKAPRLVLGSPRTCPQCGGQIYEVSQALWDIKVSEMTEDSMRFLAWDRGKCFPHAVLARSAYYFETGRS